MLQKEIEQLRYQLDHHPDVTRFASENLDLRGTNLIANFVITINDPLHTVFLRSINTL